jgi:hypothetical protein
MELEARGVIVRRGFWAWDRLVNWTRMVPQKLKENGGRETLRNLS